MASKLLKSLQSKLKELLTLLESVSETDAIQGNSAKFQLKRSHQPQLKKDHRLLLQYLQTIIEFIKNSLGQKQHKLSDSTPNCLDLFHIVVEEISSLPFIKTAVISIQRNNSLEILTASLIENLRAFTQLFQSLHNPFARKNHPQNLKSNNPDKDFFFLSGEISKYCDVVLDIHDHILQLTHTMGISHGISYFEYLFEKYLLNQQISNYMKIQRIHTCHNYILSSNSSNQRSFLCNEKNSPGLYKLLFQHGSNTSSSQLSNEYLQSSIFGDYHPEKVKNKRIKSHLYSDMLWWWDAIHDKDWELFRVMISDIFEEESSAGIENLIVKLIQVRGPSDIIYNLIRFESSLFS